jgi:parvulin-like peptidyl-prolyl isomerase
MGASCIRNSDGHQLGVRITFDELSRADANRVVQELSRALLDRVGDEATASIEKPDTDSQDGGGTLVLLFGTTAAAAIAQGIRAYLARRADVRDRITIKTADGIEVIATGEAARNLDAAALVRASHRRHDKS